jgi:thiol-disulfide isomerase/thioredoxin
MMSPMVNFDWSHEIGVCAGTVAAAGRHLLAATLLVAGATVAAAQPPPKNFILHEAPKPIAAIAFEDDQGRQRNLAEFRDKIVLLNIWATWCGPCRREMPSLDRLQELVGGADFEVIALSVDRGGLEAVRKFYTDVGIRKLAIYTDSSGKATRELATVGVPATLLIDRAGRELGRLLGPAEWDEPDIVQFLKRFIAAKSGSVMPTYGLERADGGSAPIANPSSPPGGTT